MQFFPKTDCKTIVSIFEQRTNNESILKAETATAFCKLVFAAVKC